MILLAAHKTNCTITASFNSNNGRRKVCEEPPFVNNVHSPKPELTLDICSQVTVALWVIGVRGKGATALQYPIQSFPSELSVKIAIRSRARESSRSLPSSPALLSVALFHELLSHGSIVMLEAVWPLFPLDFLLNGSSGV